MKNKLLFAGIFIMGFVCILWQVIPVDQSITAAVFKTENGYGYTISVHDKVVIKQLQIPALSQSLAFCTKNDAKKMSALVVKKLTKHQNPAISAKDLTENNIQLKCSY